MKATVLLFDTDFAAVLKTVNVKDGKVVIGNKEFIVDGVRPFTLDKIGGTRPLYILKWNSVLPMEWEVKEETHEFVEKLEGGGEKKYRAVTKDIVPVDISAVATKILPELLRSTSDMRFLKGMKLGGMGGSGKPDIQKYLPYIAIGGAFLIMVVLMATGILPQFLETVLGIKI